MPFPIKLLAGLGNPGPEYLLTRHNAGFWFVDAVAEKYSLKFRHESKFNADTSRLNLDQGDCLVCKPQTYMNRSGHALQSLSAYFRIKPEEILVVHDDIDLQPGDVRLKQGGGHGGNNGLRSIIEQMGDNNFNRVRLGVGHPGNSNDVINYVTSRPSAADTELILQSIGRAMDVLSLVLVGDMQKAMTQLHTNPEQS